MEKAYLCLQVFYLARSLIDRDQSPNHERTLEIYNIPFVHSSLGIPLCFQSLQATIEEIKQLTKPYQLSYSH